MEKEVIVYAIKSQLDGRIYVGMTTSLRRRIKEHNSGQSKSTKAYCPWVLVYSESCSNYVEARIREKYWKSGMGKTQLKNIGVTSV
jgi:putative endonuclease